MASYRLANAPTPPGSSASESEEELVQSTRREASSKHSSKRHQELDSGKLAQLHHGGSVSRVQASLAEDLEFMNPGRVKASDMQN